MIDAGLGGKITTRLGINLVSNVWTKMFLHVSSRLKPNDRHGSVDGGERSLSE